MAKTEQKSQKTTDAVKILDRMMDGNSPLRQLANEAVVLRNSFMTVGRRRNARKSNWLKGWEHPNRSSRVWKMQIMRGILSRCCNELPLR